MVQIVVPMSGVGKRFVEAGYADPKPLIEVDGKPMIEHVLGLFPGETNVVAICNEDHERVPAELKRICPTVRIVSIPHRGKGPVDAVMCAKDDIADDEEVIVTYCDYGTRWDYQEFLEDARSHSAAGAIACYRGFHPHNLGPDMYAFVRENNRNALEVREKGCFTDNKLNEYASNGTYYFQSGRLLKRYFEALIHSGQTIRNEFYVSMVYNAMIQDNLCVRVFEVDTMLQWGTPYDLETYKMWSGCFRYPPTRRVYTPGVTLLPMAGQGSRFRMEGFTLPKPFLPIFDQPMVVRAVNDLPRTDELVLITLKEHADVQPYFPDAKVVRLEKTTDGQATTCMRAIEDIPDDTPLTVSACDNGALYSPDKLEALLQDEEVDVIVWAFTNHPTSKLSPQMYAWLDVDEDMRIRDVSIKKPFADRPNTHAIIGTMYFRKTRYFKEGYAYITEHNIRTNGEYYVDNLLKPLIDMGRRVVVFPVDYYLGWGTPNDYKTFLYWARYFRREKPKVIAHRVNTFEKLAEVPSCYGIEFDVREGAHEPVVTHDPWTPSIPLSEFLPKCRHAFYIVNIKSEGIEPRVLEMLKAHGITQFFLLDCSFPMIVRLSNQGERRLAVRMSEYEDVRTALALQGKVEWIWADAFTRVPLSPSEVRDLSHRGFKVCLVSPELQGRELRMCSYFDAVCTKFPLAWTEFL